MALHRVRHDYTVHLGPGRTLGPGEVFEPTTEVLEKQGYKLDRLPDPEPETKAEAQAEPEKSETREVPKAPKDRAVKAGEAETK
jgi:hypothetical protein